MRWSIAVRAVGVLLGAAMPLGCDQPPYIPPFEAPDTAQPETIGDTDGETIGDTTGSCRVQPKLSDLRAQYFSFSCVFGGCHEASSQEGGLNLEAANLHAELVNVPANDPKAGPRGKLRVVPGDPDNSYFLQKLEGTMARDEGDLMPSGSEHPIDPNCRVKMVRQWILDGALDN